jgi:lysophospholipase L1-like esterase
VDVDAQSEYYQNNSKYYSDRAKDIYDDAVEVRDSIPADYSTLSQDVTDLKADLSTKLPFNSTFIDGSGKTEQKLDFPYVGWIRNNDGELSPVQTSYEATDYIDLSGVTGIYRTGTTTKFALWTYAFYDANKTFISAQKDTTDYQIVEYEGKQVTWLNIAVPGAKYIRITNQPSRPYEYYVVKQFTVNGYDVPHITINNTDPLKFYGKKIVNFGDSIFGNFRDTNETTDKSISRMIAEATGATVYNCGFGGCRMSWHSEHWRAFSMFALADAITTGIWTDQEAAVTASPSGMPSYFSETLALLKNIDFSTVDYITIGYGVNDFNGNVFIDERSGLTEVQYFKGALDYSLRTILTTYPNIRILVITPCWMWTPDSETGLLVRDSDDPASVNTRNLTLPDYVAACKTVSEKYHVPCIDTYTELGFNPYSYKAYFNVKGIDGAVASDGTHPKQAGRQLRADRIVGQMYSMF